MIQKLALLIEKQTKDIFEDSKVTAAAPWLLLSDTRRSGRYAVWRHKVLVRAAQVFKAQEALQQMAIITAAIGGRKLIS